MSQQDGKNDTTAEEDLENLTGDESGTDVTEDTIADDTDETVMAGETSSDALPEAVVLDKSTEANEIESRAMISYSYTLSEVKLSQNSIGGISTQTILERAKTIIEKNEGNYGTVNSNDNGALSIGKMQWQCIPSSQIIEGDYICK